MDQLIKLVEATQAVTDFPEINPGDTVKIQLKVIEGEKERLQAFEGIVISDRGAGGNKTITVRKISHGVGVERIIPVNSPNIESVTVLKHGKAKKNHAILYEYSFKFEGLKVAQFTGMKKIVK